MTELKTDQEKAEEIKKWWKENGTSVMAGVALAIAGIFGWQQWKSHQTSSSEEASALYTKISKNVDAEALSTLKRDHSSTPYATLAALATAKHAAAKDDDALAITELSWVVNNTADQNLKEIAQIRLIRLHLSLKQPEKAAAQLANTFSKAYTSLIDELKGDLLALQNKPKEAAKAYQKAILSNSNVPNATPPRYLKMKLDNLNTGA
jgi:predicted negative regulator of RcsB-dependent stress response